MQHANAFRALISESLHNNVVFINKLLHYSVLNSILR